MLDGEFRSMLNRWFDVFSVGWLVKLAILRLVSQWRSIITVVVGVLLSAMIGASVPLYTTAISQVGLAQRLNQSTSDATNIHARISLTPANLDDFTTIRTRFDDAILTQVDESFDPFVQWTDATIRWGESSTLLPVRNGRDIEAVRFRVAAYDNLQEYIEIIDGAFPVEPNDDTIDLEVAVTEEVAQTLNLNVGDEFILDQRGRDTSQLIRTQIVGIIRSQDSNNAYWFSPSPLRIDSNAQWQVESNLITTPSSLERIATEFIPETRTQFGWRVIFDNQGLPFDMIDLAITTTSDFERILSDTLQNANNDVSVTLVYQTNLNRVLQGYSGEVDQLNIPFGLILLQLGALVVFFLLVIAALVRRSERREISMLQSRGARDRDILLLRGTEMLIICLLALIIAPTIAKQMLIIFIPLFTDIDRMPLSLNGSVYGYSLVAVIFAFLILMATLLPVMRQPLISAGGSHSRGQKSSWWQRYYLDVVLLLIGLVALWQVINRDSLTTETGSSNTQADPILLIAPTLLILALGSIALRIFPNMMDFMARFFSLNRNLLPTLASWQVSREPLHYGRITFLLALAISIGWFAISFQTIVTSSQNDQALYQLGGDVQIQYGNGLTDALNSDAYRGLDAVENVTMLTRLEGQDIAPAGGLLLSGDILIIDEATFTDVAFWRDDLGELALPIWDETIPQAGEQLPFAPSTIGFWAHLETNTFDFRSNELLSEALARRYSLTLLLNDYELSVRLKDSEGNLYLFPLSIPQDQLDLLADFQFTPPNGNLGAEPPPDFDIPIPNDSWVYFETDTSILQEISADSVYFDAISMNANMDGFRTFNEPTRDFHLTDFTITDADGTSEILDLFARDEWETINEVALLPENPPAVVDDLINVEGEMVTGLNFSWRQQDERAQFGLLFNYPAIISTENTEYAGSQTPENAIVPMPIIVSRSFSEETNLIEGQLLRVFIDQTSFWTEIISVVDYYPTLYDQEHPFLILNQDILMYTLHRRPRSKIGLDEVWLDLDILENATTVIDQLSVEHQLSAITNINTMQATRETKGTNLLTLGLIGLLYISFSLALLLSLVSLITYASLSVQARQTEFAVLRALGFTNRRIMLSITIEQLFVMITAILLGIAIAFILSTQVLPTLSVSTTGENITPPFLIQFDLSLLIKYALLIITIFMIELLINTYLIRRSATIHALRQT